MRDGERKGRETHFWSIINNKCLLQKKKKKYPAEFSTSLLWKVKSLTGRQDADGKTRFQSAHVTQLWSSSREDSSVWRQQVEASSLPSGVPGRKAGLQRLSSWALRIPPQASLKSRHQKHLF